MMQGTISAKAVIIMKVGFHGQESLEDIIARKQAEEKAAGHTLWGYGGTVCHPVKQIREAIRIQKIAIPIRVCFVPTSSPLYAGGVESREWSTDGVGWQPLPEGVAVYDSRYALVIKNMKRVDGISLDLGAYEVAIGPSEGKILSKYFKFRVDKALAVRRSGLAAQDQANVLPVSYTAELVDPYAVLLRT